MCRLRTSHCDQISVSSSGSSGSDTEDLSVPQPSRLRLKLKVRAPAASRFLLFSCPDAHRTPPVASVSPGLAAQRRRGLLPVLLLLFVSQTLQVFLQLLAPQPQLFLSDSEPRVLLVLVAGRLLSSGGAAPLQQTGRRLVHHQGQRGVFRQRERLQEHSGTDFVPI